jgi:hypothetical protein
MTNSLLKTTIRDEKNKEIKETRTDKKEIESDRQRRTYIQTDRQTDIEWGKRERKKERLTYSVFPESGNKFLKIKFPSRNSGRKNFSSRYRSPKQEQENYGA